MPDPIFQPPLRIVIDGADPDSPQAQALIADNQDVIDQFVRVQRRNYDLGSIPIHKASTRTPDVGLTYQNQYGTEVLRITPYPVYPGSSSPQPSVSQPIPSPAFPTPPPPPNQPLALVVFFNDPAGAGANQGLASFDMSALPSLVPLYRGSSTTSNWGDNPIPISQYNFGNGGTIMAPMNFQAARGSPAPTHYYLTNVLLNQSVELGTTFYDSTYLDNYSWSCGQYELSHDGDTGHATGRIYPPIMNGSASTTNVDGVNVTTTTIYTPLDVYTYASGQFTYVRQGGDTQVFPYAISPDGDYYYDAAWVSGHEGSAIMDLEATQFPSGLSGGYSMPYDACSTINALYETTDLVLGGNGTWFYAQSTPGAVAAAHYGYTQGKNYSNAFGQPTTYYSDPADYSGNLPYPLYQVPGETSSPYDVLNTAMVSVSASDTWSGDVLGTPTPFTVVDTLEVSAFGKSYSITNVESGSPPTYPFPVVQLLPFPPSLSRTQSGNPYYFATMSCRFPVVGYPPPPSPLVVNTPYGVFEGLYAPSFFGWLHVSNGVHYAQGFAIDGTSHLYMDGTAFLQPLADACNCATTDIRGLIMDIPPDLVATIANVTVEIPQPSFT